MGDPFAAALASPLFAELRRRVEASGEACEGSVMHTWRGGLSDFEESTRHNKT